jgi:hypothetical protein
MDTATHIELINKIEIASSMNGENFLETIPNLYFLIKQRQQVSELLRSTNYAEEQNELLSQFNYLNENIKKLLGL